MSDGKIILQISVSSFEIQLKAVDALRKEAKSGEKKISCLRVELRTL